MMAMRLALMLLVSVCTWAQLKVDIHPVVGRASDRLKEAQRTLRVAQQLPLRGAEAPEELAVLEEVQEVYHKNFRPEIGSRPRVGVVTEKGNDVLVAKWVAPSPSPFSELIVWDAPDSTSFIFKLPSGSWSRDAAIRSTFEGLLSSAESDGRRLGPQAVYLDVARDAQTKRWIGAGGLMLPVPPLQLHTGPLNWIDLWETATASYLCAKFSACLGYGIPWYLRYIPERFPPLETRAKEWTTQRILDELDCQPERASRGGINDWIGGYDRRDRVLAKVNETRGS